MLIPPNWTLPLGGGGLGGLLPDGLPGLLLSGLFGVPIGFPFGTPFCEVFGASLNVPPLNVLPCATLNGPFGNPPEFRIILLSAVEAPSGRKLGIEFELAPEHALNGTPGKRQGNAATWPERMAAA